MTRDEATRLRAAHVPAARGVVLEVGIGSGLNLPFYTSGVTRPLRRRSLCRSCSRWRQQKAAAAPFPVTLFNSAPIAFRCADASVDTVVVTWSLCSIANPAWRAARDAARAEAGRACFIFVEHGLSPDAARAGQWQNRLTPVWRRFAGGCHLNRKIDDLVRDAGSRLPTCARNMCRDRASMTFMYEGRANEMTIER